MAKKSTSSTALATVGTSNLLEVASQFGINSEDLGELARIGADSMSRAMFEVARAGLAFMRAQELLSLGNFGNGSTVSERSDTDGFIEWINSHGLAKQRVYEAMRIAKFVTQLPQDQRDDVLALGKVKVMLLASLPQEVIDQAAESGNDLIEKADLMTVSQLKDGRVFGSSLDCRHLARRVDRRNRHAQHSLRSLARRRPRGNLCRAEHVG